MQGEIIGGGWAREIERNKRYFEVCKGEDKEGIWTMGSLYRYFLNLFCHFTPDELS